MEKLKKLIKNEFALQCALELNKAGFIISINNEDKNTNYFHVSDGKRVLYIQFEKYGAFTISTSYISTNCGTGANFLDRCYNIPSNYASWLELFKAGFSYAPNWVKGDWKFYDNFKHYQLHKKQKWNIDNILIIQNDSFYTVNEYFIKGEN